MTTLARSQETYWPVTLTSPLVAGDEVYPIATTSISTHCSNLCDWQGFQTERRVSAVWRHQQCEVRFWPFATYCAAMGIRSLTGRSGHRMLGITGRLGRE